MSVARCARGSWPPATRYSCPPRTTHRHRDLTVLPTLDARRGRRARPGVPAPLLREKGRRHQPGRHPERERPLRATASPAPTSSCRRKLVAACRAAGVKRLLHMSALHASLNAPSHYLRTKAMGEDTVHRAAADGLHVTSFRPSVIFGPRDSFVNRFAGLLKLAPGVFPLACPGCALPTGVCRGRRISLRACAQGHRDARPAL